MPSKPRSPAGDLGRVAGDEVVQVTLHDRDGAVLYQGDVR
jgi:hypothetical protein